MLGKSKDTTQRGLFSPMLIDFIDMRHELVLLGEKIDWKKLGNELSVYYSKTGRSSMPVRLMAGCLILKRLYDLGDEALATAWVMNPYMQYFCGEGLFQHRFPKDPSDFVHFRKRIGEEGLFKIFSRSLELHCKDAQSKWASDTAVRENNIIFPNSGKTRQNKTYSIRKPFTDCISKGGAHKKHEFGNKTGFLTRPKNLTITAVDAFMGNPHDSKTIEPLVGRSEEILGKRYEQIIYDRGARGQSQTGETQVLTPEPPLKRDGIYQKNRKRKQFRRGAAIEPVIGHLKKSFRTVNYLGGEKISQNQCCLSGNRLELQKTKEKISPTISFVYL